METIKIEDLEKLTADEVMKKIEWKKYVDVKEELAMAQLLAKNLVTQDENGMYVVNKNEQLILTVVAFVALYTDIELSDDDYYNFNVIDQCALIDLIDIKGRSYCAFDEMVNNEVEAILAQNSLEHIIARATKAIVNSVNNTLEHANGMLDKGDPNKVAKYLSKGIEMIANKLPDFSKMDVAQIVAAVNQDKSWKN